MKKAFWALLFVSLILTSCKNFLEAGDIKEQIEKTITYNNAKSFPLVISQETTMGSFLSSGEKECKLGYSITVQFNVKKETYIFKGLKAVKASDPDQSLDDYVEFQILERDDQKGIYKVSIKLVKESNEILIVPDCSLIPVVLTDKCKPDNYPNAWEQDSVITIVFNKPITPTEFFVPVISDGSGESLSSYFGEPYLSADSKAIYIPVANNKQLLEEDDRAETRDVIVTIDLSTIKDDDGNYGSGTIQHKYRVNKSKDDSKPVMKAVNLYSTSDTTASYYRTLANTAYSSWTYNTTNFGTYNTNHVGSSVYVEFDAEDIGSGVSCFIVKETLIKTDQGTATVSSTTTSKAQEAVKSEITGKLGATYSMVTTTDGIIKLDFFARDNSGNISNNSITYYVLKDTSIKRDSITFKNDTSDLFEAAQDGSYLVTSEERITYINGLNNSVNGNKQTVSLTVSNSSSDVYYSDQTNGISARSNYEIKVYWGYTPETAKTEVIKQNGTYSFTRDVDKPVFVNVFATDGVGNTKEVIKTIAPRLKIVSMSRENPMSPIWDRKTFEGTNSLPALCNTSSASSTQSEDIGPVTSTLYWLYIKYSLDYTNPAEHKEFVKIVSSTHPESQNPEEEFDPADDPSNSNYLFANIPQKDKKPTGSIKVYMVPSFGDMTSPVSSNYIEYKIKGWDAIPADDNESTLICNDDTTGIIYGSERLSDAIAETSSIEATNEDESPINENITVTVTTVAKTCKVEISNYKNENFSITREGNNTPITADDCIFRFYQVKIGYAPEPDPENPVEAAGMVTETQVYTNPVFYTEACTEIDSTLGYGIQIEAYCPALDQWFRPKKILSGDKIMLTEEEIEDFSLCELYNLNYDFEAPYFTFSPNDSAYDYNSRIKTGGIYISDVFDGQGNMASETKLTYYIIPSSESEVSDTWDSFTPEQLTAYYSNYKKTIDFTPAYTAEVGPNMYMAMGDDYIPIPFGKIDNGYYTVAALISDKMGNTKLKTQPLIINNKGELPWKQTRVSKTETETNLNEDNTTTTRQYSQSYWLFTLSTKNNKEITIEESEFEYENDKISIISYLDFYDPYNADPTDPWHINTGNRESFFYNTIEAYNEDALYPQQVYYVKNGEGENSYYSIYVEYRPIVPDDFLGRTCWMRVQSFLKFDDFYEQGNNPSWKDKGSYYADYFYCGTNDTTCYNKNCIEGLNGIQVFSDRPVLAHTMYSNEQLTTSKNDQNAIRIWENMGMETGLKLLNKNINEDESHSHYEVGEGIELPDTNSWHNVGIETYGSENLDLIPKGYYYTTIFHFADGSTAMTEIKQKK